MRLLKFSARGIPLTYATHINFLKSKENSLTSSDKVV